MKYTVVLTDEARKILKKLDQPIALLITGWIRKNLENCSDPRQHGKSLTANHRGQWRYRVGDYRILAEIQDAQITILIVTIGHHKNIYKTE